MLMETSLLGKGMHTPLCGKVSFGHICHALFLPLPVSHRAARAKALQSRRADARAAKNGTESLNRTAEEEELKAAASPRSQSSTQGDRKPKEFFDPILGSVL